MKDSHGDNHSSPEKISLNYPFLFLTHLACLDGTIHKKEMDKLLAIGKDAELSQPTWEAMDHIVAQSDLRKSVDWVSQRISASARDDVLYLAALISSIDGHVDGKELQLIRSVASIWGIENARLEEILGKGFQDAENERRSDALNHEKEYVSRMARFIRGLDKVFSRNVVDAVASAGTTNLKESIGAYRTQALISGPEYDDAIAICRDIGNQDIYVAESALISTEQALSVIDNKLDSVLTRINAKINNKAKGSAAEIINHLTNDKNLLETEARIEIRKIIDALDKKKKAINYFTLSFMGKSKAGKSTLHAIVTGDGWDAIGIGKQNTTRLNREYEWRNIRIVDTPGIAAPDGQEFQKIAESIIDESDLMCFVVTNNNQQKEEFEFLKKLKEKGKPLLVLMNVQENLSNETRLRRFLEKPDDIFSMEPARLGGHFDRIRRDAKAYYGTSAFPIVPVQLMAARLARQEDDPTKADQLHKASRLQNFLDSVRLSLVNEGAIRRSQNLLGSTVVDLEYPLNWLQGRETEYKNLSAELENKLGEAQSRLKKAEKTLSRQLQNSLKSVFQRLQSKIPEFADDNYEMSETELNDEWQALVEHQGMEKAIRDAAAAALSAFEMEVKETLEEIGREIALASKLHNPKFNLMAQDTDASLQVITNWGGKIAAAIGSIGLVLHMFDWVPGIAAVSWGLTIVGGIMGFLSSFFESKESKKRKAVKSISQELEKQVTKQEKAVLSAINKTFNEQCHSIDSAIVDYFQYMIEGSREISKVLNTASREIERQRDHLNICFASRIIDFGQRKVGDLDMKQIRRSIQHVDRVVGHKITITINGTKLPKFDTNKLGETLQEEITFIAGESIK